MSPNDRRYYVAVRFHAQQWNFPLVADRGEAEIRTRPCSDRRIGVEDGVGAAERDVAEAVRREERRVAVPPVEAVLVHERVETRAKGQRTHQGSDREDAAGHDGSR